MAAASPLERRDRTIVTLAGVVPDVDGLGAAAELVTRGSERPLLWFSTYHHSLAHNIGAALLVGAAAWALGRRKLLTTVLALGTFHLHLVGDLVGSRGPDGSQWPIPYLAPFSESAQWVWSGQWALNAWPNVVLTLVLLGLTFRFAWGDGISPLEMVSPRANEAFVTTLRHRFPPAGGSEPRPG